MSASQNILLPKTDFPMKGSLATTEPVTQSWWQEIGLYGLIRMLRKDRPVKVLADGPPYANGDIHLGHALNKILKDMMNRFNAMHGWNIDFVPVWDCHGLPIESQVEKDYLKQGRSKHDVSPLKLREDCQAYAEFWITRQSSSFQRLGVLGDFDHYQSTMQPQFEGAVIEALFKLLNQGQIYQGNRPVLWSCAEQTALAEAEVEYKEVVSTALYVKFPLTDASCTSLGYAKHPVSVIIWTTTPWSLPGNRAVCYHDAIQYALVRVEESHGSWQEGEYFIIAQERLEALNNVLNLGKHTVIHVLESKTLGALNCRHPLYDLGYTFTVPLLSADHVTCDIGTGLVHTAPSHGPEDFAVGLKHGLDVPETILPDGAFSASAPGFTGLNMWNATPAILEALQNSGSLITHAPYHHTYPHSWRSKTPLCYRAAPQWFIGLDYPKDSTGSLREKAIAAVEGDAVSWHPKGSHKRLSSMLQHRPDWCISRQRAWGIPLMFFVNKETGECLKDPAVFAVLQERVLQEGVNFWFTDAPFEMFPHLSKDTWKKVEDIMDVWLESGLTHIAVLKPRDNDGQSLWPAWAYVEGSDQHRGWFQSSLLTSIALEGRPPFESVITHGFLLDEQGEKQSKSKGNVVNPIEFANQQGADILRLWAAHEDYEKDISVGKAVFQGVEDMYRKCRNTLRFLLGALQDLRAEELLRFDQLDFFSRHTLWNMARTHQELLKALSLKEVTQANFSERCLNIQSFVKTLINFCNDVSALYVDVKKDTLYCEAVTSLKRYQVRTTLLHVFIFLCKHLGPILAFTTEEAFSMFGKEILGLGEHVREQDWKHHLHDEGKLLWQWMIQNNLLQDTPYWSVHLQTVYAPCATLESWDRAPYSTHLIELRKEVMNALEASRQAKMIKSSLEAKVILGLTAQDEGIAGAYAPDYPGLLEELCLTSAFEIRWGQVERNVTVEALSWDKCPRCWKLTSEVTSQGMCPRCTKVCVTQA